MNSATTTNKSSSDAIDPSGEISCTALVEIVHLHDCFRSALKNLNTDVEELCQLITSSQDGRPLEDSSSMQTGSQNNTSSYDRIIDLERRVAGRFTVIWSVFRAHSAAEDEFIWPALKAKQVALPSDACNCNCASALAPEIPPPNPQPAVQGGGDVAVAAAAGAAQGGQLPIDNDIDAQQRRERAHSMTVHTIEQEEYEEDHADEERMFNSVNTMLSNLRGELNNRRKGTLVSVSETGGSNATSNDTVYSTSLQNLAQMLLEGTRNLMRHLMTHLDKEETHCMPLVAQYLTKAEINDLVGKIMGKRSSELMSQILTMAVQNLNEADRDDMVHYMKQAMVGTFFERWLKMGGWMEKTGAVKTKESDDDDDDGGKMSRNKEVKAAPEPANLKEDESDSKMAASLKEPTVSAAVATSSSATASALNQAEDEDQVSETYTSAVELEKLIRAIGTNPHLDAKQKNLTIQGLRDSVWKSNCRLSKRKREESYGALEEQPASQVARPMPMISSTSAAASAAAVASTQSVATGTQPSQSHHMSFSLSGGTRFKRDTPPSYYFKKMRDGEIKLVWSSNPHSTQFHPNDSTVPLFSASELAPTYHDGGINHILGCPHYARTCKLRHPTSGRLYTCRLCCEQTREMANKDKDSPLDRYEVKEILCMRCGALQPAGDKCVNPECQSVGKSFARYTCNICNFYDNDANKAIYHCPFCNVCRSGKGLGIDYRHCMRCNACVSLKDDHHCIPQRLQGNCPICHETMFESTEPLRGLKCGHVMHLSCFSMYMRGHSYTCPLCKKSAEDMSEYFALLDSAVRMQPMPPCYAATTSNIYCQDCNKMGNVAYHFVGLKCQHCGSYNTRELQRVDANMLATIAVNL